MASVLVADDERDVREALVDILFAAGYEVAEAADGGTALQKALAEQPDVILLDVMMPVANGFEVLKSLRENSATVDIPVIMLTVLEAATGEHLAMESGVEHYITKPWEPGIVEATIRIILREEQTVNTPVRTGEHQLDQKLGGGIPMASLTLIEGTSSSGKSVLSQHLMSGALREGHQVACFTSENSARSLVTQMGSIGMDVASAVRARKFIINTLDEPSLSEDPGTLLAELGQAIAQIPKRYKVICVDAITNLSSISEDPAIIGFFSSCKRVSNGGKVIILVAHSFAFDEKMLTRLRSMCDAHLSLRVETTGAKQTRMMEVSKIHNSEGTTGDVVFFNVEPQFGMRMVPFSRAKA